MTSTFWGLRLEPGKRYSTTVDKSFHVSMAALDCTTVKNEKDVHCVMLEEGESSIPFILCNLHKPKILQSRLNLNFESGDRITFFCRGSGVVHLTGYIIPEDDDLAQFGEDGEEMEEEEDAEEEEEDEDEEEKDMTKLSKVNGLPVKRKGASAAGLPSKKKKKGIEPDSDEDDDDDDSDAFMEDGEEEDESGDSSGEEEADSDEESESVPQVQQKKPSPSNLEQQGKKKKKNKQKQGGEGQQSPSPGSPQAGKQGQQNKGAQQNAAQQKKKQQQQPPAATEKPAAGKKTLEGGVAVQDLKIGNGPVCKPGKMAVVYYTGRLKSNSKVFDQTSHGPGFKFRVGRGEVIKGWDVGVAGMKVGGKRLITCPPNMAYGQKGNPPTIPANSTLVFEVELKGVH